MTSRKKTKALWVLSMAAAATLGGKAAQGADLSLYYDNINVLSGTDPQSYGYAAQGGGTRYTGPTTINIQVGDTFEFGIDAVLTNNVNPDAGKDYGPKGHDVVQPSCLGLSSLAIVVPSTDTYASKLAPNVVTPAFGTLSGVPEYYCTVSFNNAVGTQSVVGSNNGAASAPNWSASTPGEVYGSFGADTVTNAGAKAISGDIGVGSGIFQGNSPQPNTVAGMAALSQYGAATANYGTATDFFDSLSYTAIHPGTVTLSPYSSIYDASYWENTMAGSASVAPGYKALQFTNAGDVMGTLPVLVINITGPLPTAQPIISLTSAAPVGYGSNEGTASVVGSGYGSAPGYLAVAPAATSYVHVNGFDPQGDEEIYALDVLVNGSQANSAQIAVLIDAIVGDGLVPSSNMLATDAWYGLAAFEHAIVFGPDPFLGTFNLFLETVNGPGPDAYLGFDVSSRDSNLEGYTISEVAAFAAAAAVPEPTTLGLLALGGLGLLNQRPRRQRRNR